MKIMLKQATDVSQVSVYRTIGPLVLVESRNLTHYVCLIGEATAWGKQQCRRSYKTIIIKPYFRHKTEATGSQNQDKGRRWSVVYSSLIGKNPSKIFFSRTGKPILTKLGM